MSNDIIDAEFIDLTAMRIKWAGLRVTLPFVAFLFGFLLIPVIATCMGEAPQLMTDIYDRGAFICGVFSVLGLVLALGTYIIALWYSSRYE
jgi:pheromone shutdown protein TraB